MGYLSPMALIWLCCGCSAPRNLTLAKCCLFYSQRNGCGASFYINAFIGVELQAELQVQFWGLSLRECPAQPQLVTHSSIISIDLKGHHTKGNNSTMICSDGYLNNSTTGVSEGSTSQDLCVSGKVLGLHVARHTINLVFVLSPPVTAHKTQLDGTVMHLWSMRKGGNLSLERVTLARRSSVMEVLATCATALSMTFSRSVSLGIIIWVFLCLALSCLPDTWSSYAEPSCEEPGAAIFRARLGVIWSAGKVLFWELLSWVHLDKDASGIRDPIAIVLHLPFTPAVRIDQEGEIHRLD